MSGTSSFDAGLIASADGTSIVGAIHGFVRRLRSVGVPVSMVETSDSIAALGHVDIADRSAFKAALATTLVKRVEDGEAFESLFESYFAVRREASPVQTSLDRADGTSTADGQRGERAEGGAASTDMLKALLAALRADDRAALHALAELAVTQFARVRAEGTSSERYYLYRVLRQLELSELLRKSMLLEPDELGTLSPLAERLLRDERNAQLEEFRRMISAEIRRQMAERRPGAEASAGDGQAIEDVDFLRASPTELREMREAIRPLARKLAARIARRHRSRRRGRLDIRRTIRRSLSSGGVPLDPAFRHPKASRPELYLLCDISGSVAEFARFTMSLLYATKAEFARIRLFTFVDGIDDVTDLMDDRGYQLAPRNLLYGTDVIAADGHSDYGSVFRRFWHVHGFAELDPRSTVIITGDARNNYRDPGLDAFKQIAARAPKLYWLNPDPRAEWDTTDSLASLYGAYCRRMFEARNLGQLATFVSQIG